MAKLFVVGFGTFPSGTQVKFYSHEQRVSLDDADAVLFALPSPPSTYNPRTRESRKYKNRPILNDEESFRYRELIFRWSSELNSAVAAGKTVFVPLTSPEVVYTTADEARDAEAIRRGQRFVKRQTNLDVLPSKLEHVVPGFGDEFRTTPRSRILDPYWEKIGPISRYEFHFALQDPLVPLLTTRNPNHVVSALVEYVGHGNLVLIPAVDPRKRERLSVPTELHRLAHLLLQVHEQLKSGAGTPPPDWVQATRYETTEQRRLRGEYLQAQAAEVEARKQQQQLQASLEDASVLQGLLFAQGRPLQDAVIRGLKVMGIEAEGFADGESEFDAVFTIDGQRMLGEAEGRDSKAIAIDKITQLERNVAEDFARDGVEEYAHGVLFGNPQRLVAPGDRTETFTDKCISSAKRNCFALVLTHTMFGPVAYLEESGDTDYAAKCRAALVAAKGEVVEFPEVPEDYCSPETSEAKATVVSGE